MQAFDSNGIQDLTMAYVLQGRPLALETFRAYNIISMLQALYLLSNLKLGHYLKILPRSIFLVQVMTKKKKSIEKQTQKTLYLHFFSGSCPDEGLALGPTRDFVPGESTHFHNQ